MQPLPQIFNGVKFVEPPDQSTLSPEAIKRLDAVRAAWNELQIAEQKVADAQEHVTAALQDVAAAEEIVKPYGKYNFHRLWLQHVKGI